MDNPWISKHVYLSTLHGYPCIGQKQGKTFKRLFCIFESCPFEFKFMENIWPTTPYNYSASFCTSSFSIAYGRNRKPLSFMISGFSNVSMTPQTNMICLWRDQDTSNNSRNNPNHVREILF